MKQTSYIRKVTYDKGLRLREKNRLVELLSYTPEDEDEYEWEETSVTSREADKIIKFEHNLFKGIYAIYDKEKLKLSKYMIELRDLNRDTVVDIMSNDTKASCLLSNIEETLELLVEQGIAKKSYSDVGASIYTLKGVTLELGLYNNGFMEEYISLEFNME